MDCGSVIDSFKRGEVTLTPRDRERLEALYDGEITYHDRCFGHFLTRLAELGLADSTLLVVTSDHSEEFFEHDSLGHGHSLFQELLHVPLLFRLPGGTPAGGRLGQMCSLVDVTPTVLEATAIEEGTFLGSSGREPLCPDAGKQILAGSAKLACVTLGAPVSAGGEAGPDGAGVLATVEFTATGKGETPLGLQDVKLVAADR